MRSSSPIVSLTRAINTGARVMHRAGMPLPRLDPDVLCDEARRRTRLDDFDDPDGQLHEALSRLSRSLRQEAGLSLIGRIAARQDLVRLLANRLRIVEDRRCFPEIAAGEVRQPLFVTGLPRTGTTLLHGLLAQDPASRAPLHWEMIFPSPPERSRGRAAARIAAAERQLRWFHRLQPDLKHIHAVEARLPEECLIITSHSFLSFQFQTSHHVPSYESWLERHDLRASYSWHRRFLQQLQLGGRDERWVLKAPAHLFGLPALFAAYPDAGVIFTHRDPLEVAGSLASLTTTLRSTFSDTVDPVAVGREMTARWAGAMARALHDRDAGCAPPSRFVDVRYDDLLRDPIGAVRAIYTHYDLRLTALAEERMRAFLAANPKDKHGRHRYALADFGLDRDEELARYAAYRSRFDL